MGDPDRYEPLPSLVGLPRWLLRKLPPRRRRVVLAGLAVAGLAVVVLGASVIIRATRDERARTAAEQRERAAAAEERRARDQETARPRTGSGPAAAGLPDSAALRARRALVGRLESSVLADAQGRARRGELEREADRTSCARYPKNLEKRPPQDDLSLPAARFECIAVTAEVPASELSTGSLIGYPFRAQVDFERGRYAWCRIVQRPGELSITKEPVVVVPRACGGS